MKTRRQPRYDSGDMIGGRFLVHEVKMGGMGEVYLGYDFAHKEPRALKTFQSHLSNQGRQLFHDEVYKWIQLEKHANIVRCYYMRELDNQPFMSLEWIAGEEGKGTDLRSWLRHGPLDLRLALDFTIDICRGLIHAHEKQPGIVHRDLKPGNILITQTHLAKITDFGLATVVQETEIELSDKEDSSPDAHLTRHKGAVGTPPYMSPEQWRNEPLDARSDIYAIGCILHEMLAGKYPFTVNFRPRTKAEWRKWLSAWQTHHAQSPLPTLPATIPASISIIIQTCLAKERGNRFASVEELLKALSQHYTTLFAQSPTPLAVSTTMTATDYNDRGNTYQALKHYDDALADFGQAIALKPDFSTAYYNRGNACIALGRYDDALVDYGQAIAFKPDHAYAHYNRGKTYHDLGHYDKALADYVQAIALKPNFAQPYFSRGNIYRALKRYNEALADYGQAIALKPDDAEAYNNRGHTYQTLRRYLDALADFGEAIALRPDYADTYYNRGITYQTLGRYDEALADFGQAIALKLDDVNAYINRGSTYASLGRYDEALADFEQAIALKPDDVNAYVNRGSTYARLGCYDEALADYGQAIVLKPDHAPAYYNRGYTYQNLGHYNEALVDYGQAIAHKPDDATAYNSRGITYHTLGRYNEALADYGQAIALKPNYVDAYNNRGYTCHTLKRYDDALADYGQAIALKPDYADAYVNRGYTYHTLKRYDDALADYGQAIALKPDLAQAYVNRGITYKTLKRYDDALANYAQAIALKPDLAQAYVNIGVLFYNRGQLRKALFYLEKGAQLGDSNGAQNAQIVRQMLGITPVQQAFQAFQEASSFDEMRQVVGQFLFMMQDDFITLVADTIQKQVPPENRPYFEQRLAWLRQVANG